MLSNVRELVLAALLDEIFESVDLTSEVTSGFVDSIVASDTELNSVDCQEVLLVSSSVSEVVVDFSPDA